MGQEDQDRFLLGEALRRGTVSITGFLTIIAALDVLGIIPTRGLQRIIRAISRRDDDPPDSGAGTGEGSIHVDFSKEGAAFVIVSLLAVAGAVWLGTRSRPRHA